MLSILRPIFDRTANDKYHWVKDTALRDILSRATEKEKNDLFVHDLMRLYDGLAAYNKEVNSQHTIDIVLPRQTDYMLRAEGSLLELPSSWLKMGLYSGRIMGTAGGSVLEADFVTESNAMVSFLHVKDDTFFKSKKSVEFLTTMDLPAFMSTLFSDTHSQLTNFNTDFVIA